MNRSEEIRQLIKLSVGEVKKRAGGHVLVLKSSDAIYTFFAEHMINTIQENNEAHKETAIVLPFGPVGQYPYFIEKVNKEKISLASTYFFFMDEYADINGVEVHQDHPLSFRGRIFEMFKKIDKELLPGYSKFIFPSCDNIYSLKKMVGEANLCVTYGGIGIHGHIAFNEPETGIRDTDPRIVQLNDFTVTFNTVWEGIGGNIENFPRKALTLGMNQLFSAEKMIFFCRNGNKSLEWANTVLRLALLGKPGDDYPVTYLKEHKDWLVVTDEDTIRSPLSI